MKLAIAGYRGFADYHLFKHHLIEFIEQHGEPVEIISGGAKGADAMAERYAKEENLPRSRPETRLEDPRKKSGHLAQHRHCCEMYTLARVSVGEWERYSRYN